ncbi:MAG: glycosyltransferase [Planctomycetota bacterium]
MDSTQDTTPIRVGFVMHKMQVAGAEVLVTQIIEQLEGRIDPVVLCLDAVGELGYKLIEKGVPVISLDREPGMDWGVAKRLADEIKSRNLEVIHAHQYTPFFYAALARLRHRAKAKVIFTEHGRHYPDIVSWKRRWANRLLLQRYADITTACCDFSTEALKNIEGFPKAFTLPNGVDLRELPARGGQAEQEALRRKLELDIERPYAACIARFHPVKDHATLIRAWHHVHESLPAAKLLLVGDGPERQNLESLVRELSEQRKSFSNSIEFLGVRNDVGEILRAVDVFSLTSVSEAASLTLLEAMASECASVVTDVGGNGEHLREGMDGYLVPRGDHGALASRLGELLASGDRSREMGKSAREQVQAKFNLPDAVSSYLKYFTQLAEHAPSFPTERNISDSKPISERSA